MRNLIAPAAALALLGAATSLAAQEPREVPVYDLETPGHDLQVRVAVRELAGQPVAWAELEALADSDEAPAPVRTSALYLARVAAERWDDLPELYWMETTSPRGVAMTGRFLHQVLERLGELESARFLRSWHFGDFQALLVEIVGSEDRRIVTLGLTERGGDGVRRSDDWAEARPVMELFYYLGNVVQRGLLEGRLPREMPLSLLLPAETHPVVLQLEGTIGESAAAAGAVRRAAELARAGADAELIDLWAPAEREEVAGLLASTPGRFGGLREDVAAAAGSTPLLTAELGDFRVHYFRRPGGPEVRALVLRETGGELFLTQELYSNLETLMRSDLVKNQVAALVAGEDEE